MFEGIEHVAIAARQPASLMEFYRSVLDFEVKLEDEGNYLLQSPNGSLLELIRADLSPGDSAAVPAMRAPGMRHLAIAVTDFENALHRLRDAGVTLESGPYQHRGNHIVFFRDPEGTLLHLIQRKASLR